MREFVKFMMETSRTKFSNDIWADLANTTLDVDVETIHVCHYEEACYIARNIWQHDAKDINDSNYPGYISLDNFIWKKLREYKAVNPEINNAKLRGEIRKRMGI